ncbi:MAG: DHH family phosphoesterase [Patescibacteria group bacterium]|nr:DHH family phosphoesterase [Patescibacteria group bacterium]
MKSYRLRERAHDELLLDLLAARGISPTENSTFLEPDFVRDSHDPFLLPDMGKAVERLLFAAKHNERIAVWSDYDCDGIPGGVMLAEFFRSIGIEVTHYIPHRHKEGYGLNAEGIDELAAQNIKLIVTVDLGTTEHTGIAHAKTKNIDVIVTDHHLVAPEEVASRSLSATSGVGILVKQLPPALALINPKRPDSKYPFDGLCGAGVAWKLVQAMLIKLRASDNSFDYAQGKEKWFLDLVGIATLSDMVPLVGENRMLARFGLRVVGKARRPGLAALLRLLRIKPHMVTEDDIGFMVSPRINAASRMDSPHIAARLLAATEAQEAEDLARMLNKINDERKGIVAATVKEVNKRLASTDLTKSPLIVMGNPNWRPGILGLVANSLVGAHGKPVFLWGREGGEVIRGSVRSDGVLNVVELMGATSDIFDHFGGHHASGGFSLAEERVHELAPRLTAAYAAVTSKAVIKEIVIDRELDLAEIAHAKRGLDRLAPFGTGNEKPLFVFPNTSVSNVRTFGKTQDHLELSLTNNSTPLGVGGIAFFSTVDSFNKKIEKGMKADIVGHVENDWKGQPRIRVVDMI